MFQLSLLLIHFFHRLFLLSSFLLRGGRRWNLLFPSNHLFRADHTGCGLTFLCIGRHVFFVVMKRSKRFVVVIDKKGRHPANLVVDGDVSVVWGKLCAFVGKSQLVFWCVCFQMLVLRLDDVSPNKARSKGEPEKRKRSFHSGECQRS